MNYKIEELEKELNKLFIKSSLPDVDKYPNSFYYKSTGDCIFSGDSLMFVYVKFEDSNKKRNWSLTRCYTDIRGGYTEEKHIQLLQKNINILKSIQS